MGAAEDGKRPQASLSSPKGALEQWKGELGGKMSVCMCVCEREREREKAHLALPCWTQLASHHWRKAE